jgi:hypothetical protein
MKIEQPTENSLYVTIGNFTYYFDDSIEGDCYIKRWHKNDDLRFSQEIFDINDPELLQTTESE